MEIQTLEPSPVNTRDIKLYLKKKKTVHSARQIERTLKAAEFSDHSQIDA